MTTTNLADFGYRELSLLCELLTALKEQGLPKDFYDEEVVPMMNTNSGCVFLTNSEYQVAMMNGKDLETWYTLGYDGQEGFLDDLIISFDRGEMDEENYEEFQHILEINGRDEKAEEVENIINGEPELNHPYDWERY